MNHYDEFDQYLRASEPAPKERAGIWQTAIGLQKVDGLDVSDFLVETAKRHIEGEIDIDTVWQLISGYYRSAESREQVEGDMEADTASSNIVKLLSEPSFTFSVEGLAGIHRRIFHNVFKHAGKFRDYDISKKEWVLDGESVIYGPACDLRRILQYDLDLEKSFRYKGLDSAEIINHLATFISGLWQIHPFREGNTRTTAVFAIKYLRSLGFKVENDMFKAHSLYFRNALVRANYHNVVKGIESAPNYLILFFRNLLLGENNELKNRYLHVRWDEVNKVSGSSQEISGSSQETAGSSQERLQENTGSSQENSRYNPVDNRERVLIFLRSNPTITLQEIADKMGLTRRGVQKITDRLKAGGIIRREGSTKAGKWINDDPD